MLRSQHNFGIDNSFNKVKWERELLGFLEHNQIFNVFRRRIMLLFDMVATTCVQQDWPTFEDLDSCSQAGRSEFDGT